MRRQLWLVVLVGALFATTLGSTTEDPSTNLLHEGENHIDTSSEPPKTIKLSEIKLKKSLNATTNRSKSDDDDVAKKIPLASDPRYNKMLPETIDHLNDVKSNATEKDDDEYYYDYDDYNYDEASSENKSTTSMNTDVKTKSTTTSTELPAAAEEKLETIPKLKPIKGTETNAPKLNTEQSLDDANDDTDDDDEDEDADEDDDDDDDKEYDDDDDIADEDQIDFNENVPCPRDCVCARNINSYLFATCSRLDLDKQKFGPGITDLIVADVGPKYPILLGPDFFVKIGLKFVSSIKISNCTIEYMHEDAFNGLDELYAVNLTNVGLTIINPNTFVQNKKLRMLTISGNDLSVMSNVHYLLKSDGIEELDLSRNNLMELKKSAFSQLSSIVYINLAQNNLRDLPNGVFDTLADVEELDLSYNSLKVLPKGVFNSTALSILHLKYNEITGDLNFGADDLQKLDLSYCSIKQIHHGMFDKMIELTNLNLKGNGITKIQPDSFLQLKNLRHIDLSFNALDQVSSLLFYKNSELDVIRLNDNPRLSQLPTDGFQSYNGFFTVYLLDVSNCAIGALGHKTFSTMPHLTTLKLSWNNVNNLGRDTFAALNKLVELDLSNNLIDKLDDLIFMNNNDMTKLNLAGNPIRKLPTRLFMPLNKLRELDVSECDLHTILNDNSNGMSRQYKFFETLRSFNASSNQIRKISTEDIKPFKNLRTLDLSYNPLKCNEELKGMIVYATMKNILPGKVPTMANLDATTFTEHVRPVPGWDELAHEVCKHNADAFKPKEQTMEEIKKDILKGDDVDIQKLFYRKEQREEELLREEKKIEEEEKQKKKAEEEKKLAEDLAEDTSVNEDEDGDTLIGNGFEDSDTLVGDSDEDEDDEDDDSRGASIHELDFNAKGVELAKETKDKYLLNKLAMDGDDDDDDDDEDEDEDDDDDDSEEIIIERGRIYYNGYRFFIPTLIIVTCVIVLLLAIGKIVSMMMRKRGERYRMALLASKNSIVYQKLSEDIVKPNPCMKQPKVHKYSPINQV